MKTHTAPPTDSNRAVAPRTRRIPGWMWFIALWVFGVASALTAAYVFKIFMNLTLFAVTK